MALLFYSSSKRTSFTRKDSTAIGQTASLAAVALLLNTNNPSTTTPDPELAGGPERDSERIRSYRNSVAYIDAEVETLISRQRRGSKFVLPRLVNLIIQLFWNIHLWTTIWSLNWSLILMPWYIFNVLLGSRSMLDNPYSPQGLIKEWWINENDPWPTKKLFSNIFLYFKPLFFLFSMHNFVGFLFLMHFFTCICVALTFLQIVFLIASGLHTQKSLPWKHKMIQQVLIWQNWLWQFSFCKNRLSEA